MSAVYFGGSRSLPPSPIVRQVVSAVVAAGHPVHVACQLGADLQVAYACPPSSLVVFAVAPFSSLPWHVRVVNDLGARVRCEAGGTATPMPARFLPRSIAAFQGCEAAVFFEPDPGSLAVAQHCRMSIPVYAFSTNPPAVFYGFPCWQWSVVVLPLFG